LTGAATETIGSRSTTCGSRPHVGVDPVQNGVQVVELGLAEPLEDELPLRHDVVLQPAALPAPRFVRVSSQLRRSSGSGVRVR
jgi:hypothetical protein